MDKLINCGCGGKPRIAKKILMGNLPDMYVLCENCSIRTKEYYSVTEAIMAWNTAMGAKDINVLNKDTVLIEPFDANLTHVGYCICGELVNIDYSYCPRCGRKIEWRRMTL